MSLKVSIFNALKSLVGNRVTPDMFPQSAGFPISPAIRYSFVSGQVYGDLCGDGDASSDDVSVQIDWIADTSKARDDLTPLIRAAMHSITPPCTMDGPVITTFDTETQLYRAIASWTFYSSSD